MTAFEWLETFGGNVALMIPELERSFEYELRDLLYIGRKELQHHHGRVPKLSWLNEGGRKVKLWLLSARAPDLFRGLGFERAWVHQSLVRHNLPAIRNLQICCLAGRSPSFNVSEGRFVSQFERAWNGRQACQIPRHGIATSCGLSTPVQVLDTVAIFRHQTMSDSFRETWELLAGPDRGYGGRFAHS